MNRCGRRGTAAVIALVTAGLAATAFGGTGPTTSTNFGDIGSTAGVSEHDLVLGHGLVVTADGPIIIPVASLGTRGGGLRFIPGPGFSTYAPSSRSTTATSWEMS